MSVIVACCVQVSIGAKATASDVVFERQPGQTVANVCGGPLFTDDQELSNFFALCQSKIMGWLDLKTFHARPVVASLGKVETEGDNKTSAVYMNIKIESSCTPELAEATKVLLRRASPFPLTPNALPFSRGMLVQIDYPSVTVSLIPKDFVPAR